MDSTFATCETMLEVKVVFVILWQCDSFYSVLFFYVFFTDGVFLQWINILRCQRRHSLLTLTGIRLDQHNNHCLPASGKRLQHICDHRSWSRPRGLIPNWQTSANFKIKLKMKQNCANSVLSSWKFWEIFNLWRKKQRRKRRKSRQLFGEGKMKIFWDGNC